MAFPRAWGNSLSSVQLYLPADIPLDLSKSNHNQYKL